MPDKNWGMGEKRRTEKTSKRKKMLTPSALASRNAYARKNMIAPIERREYYGFRIVGL